LKYSVVIERDEDGVYVASIPEFPGCHTQAKNLNDLISRIREATKLYLEEMGKEDEKRGFVGIRILGVTSSEP
jgi:predicted RNase H-like HicB family nuclease